MVPIERRDDNCRLPILALELTSETSLTLDFESGDVNLSSSNRVDNLARVAINGLPAEKWTPPFLEIPPPLLLLQAASTLTSCDFLRQFRPFGTFMRRIIRTKLGRQTYSPQGLRDACSLAGLLFPKRIECLTYNAGLFVLLRRYGWSPALVFGVRPRPFESHVWLECCGEVLSDFVENIDGWFQVIRFTSS